MSQDPFSQYMRQLQKRATGGRPGGGVPGGAGLFAGSGLLIALIAGGFALNASLFNGEWLLACMNKITIKLSYSGI